MSRQVFFVFCFLFVCSTLCQQTCAAHSVQVQSETDGNTFDDFLQLENEKIKAALESAKQVPELKDITVDNIESVFFLAVDGVMAALAEMNKKEESDGKSLLLAKYIETKNDGWGERALKQNKEENLWKVQLNEKGVEKKIGNTVMKGFAVAAIKEKTIYFFKLSNDVEKAALPNSSPKLNVKLFVNKFTFEGGTGKTTEWKSTNISGSYEKSQLKELITIQQANIPLLNNFAFVIGDKIYIVSVMKSTEATSDDNNKKYIAVFQLEKKSDAETLELLRVENLENCSPYFFQWKEEIFRILTDDPKCENKGLMVFNSSNNSFTQSKSSIAGLRDFLKDKNNFATATIGEGNNNNVLLLTQEKKVDETKRNVYLWMYDGTRVSIAGSFVIEAKETLYMSIVYTEKELFALHQKYKKGGENDDNKFTLRQLKGQLKNITSIFQAWKKDDDNIKQLCKNTNNDKNNICTNLLKTDGLVGFLHNVKNESTNEWKDEYYYTNATVKNGNMLTNGLKFNEPNAGAKWPVGKQQEDQPYNFAHLGFTLVAIVNIGESSKQIDNSLLGLVLHEQEKNFGLWCSSGNWAVGNKEKTFFKKSKEKCKQEQTYIVGLVLNKNNNLAIYVDGNKLNDLDDEKLKIDEGKNITYFYFGADIEGAGDTQSVNTDVTITNVLLYNRPFNTKEIKKIEVKKNNEEISQRQPAQNNNTDNAQGNEQTLTVPSTDSNGEKDKEKKDKSPSPSRTEDGGVGGGVRVFSLLLPLLCFSALLLHL